MQGNCSISEEADLSNAADPIKAVAALAWVGLAFAAVLILRNVVRARGGSLTRLGVGPSGVTMEFAQAKLDEAVRGASEQDQHAVGQAAKRSVLDRPCRQPTRQLAAVGPQGRGSRGHGPRHR